MFLTNSVQHSNRSSESASSDNFYFGLNSLDKFENEMSWSSGSPLFYTNWRIKQPSDVNNTEKCAFYDGASGQWVRAPNYNDPVNSNSIKLRNFIYII